MEPDHFHDVSHAISVKQQNTDITSTTVQHIRCSIVHILMTYQSKKSFFPTWRVLKRLWWRARSSVPPSPPPSAEWEAPPPPPPGCSRAGTRRTWSEDTAGSAWLAPEATGSPRSDLQGPTYSIKGGLSNLTTQTKLESLYASVANNEENNSSLCAYVNLWPTNVLFRVVNKKVCGPYIILSAFKSIKATSITLSVESCCGPSIIHS